MQTHNSLPAAWKSPNNYFQTVTTRLPSSGKVSQYLLWHITASSINLFTLPCCSPTSSCIWLAAGHLGSRQGTVIPAFPPLHRHVDQWLKSMDTRDLKGPRRTVQCIALSVVERWARMQTWVSTIQVVSWLLSYTLSVPIQKMTVMFAPT